MTSGTSGTGRLRGATLAGQLAALGFADTARAQRLLTEDLGLDPAAGDSGLIEALAAAADPDLALASLARLPPDTGLWAVLRADPDFRARLIAVLGASAALGSHLARHPGHWSVLSGAEALRRPAAGEVRDELLAAVGAAPGDREPGRRGARRQLGSRDGQRRLERGRREVRQLGRDLGQAFGPGEVPAGQLQQPAPVAHAQRGRRIGAAQPGRLGHRFAIAGHRADRGQ